jgi:hypothetical protein
MTVASDFNVSSADIGADATIRSPPASTAALVAGWGIVAAISTGLAAFTDTGVDSEIAKVAASEAAGLIGLSAALPCCARLDRGGAARCRT